MRSLNSWVMSDQKVKRWVGKYEVGKTIVQGTFAKVRYAKDIETGESVALKILDKDKLLKTKMSEQVKFTFLISIRFFSCLLSCTLLGSKTSEIHREICLNSGNVMCVLLRLLLQIKIEICTMMLINHPNVVQLYEVHLHAPTFLYLSLFFLVQPGIEISLESKQIC